MRSRPLRRSVQIVTLVVLVRGLTRCALAFDGFPWIASYTDNDVNLK